MTRAAILFASATTIAGCGGKEADDINKTNQDNGTSGGASSSSSSSSTSSSGGSTSSSTSSTSGQPGPMYGPAVIDAGDQDAGRDGGIKRDGGVVALYGPSPVDAGG